MALDPSARIWTRGLGNTAPVVVSHRYRTELFQADDGTPQRRANDDRPRRVLEFPVVVRKDWYRALMRELHKYSRALWGIPDWTRKRLTTTAIATSGSSVDVAAVENWMVVGESVILRNNGRAEAYEIQTVSAPTLTFTTSNAGAEWPIGTQVHPALPAYLRSRLEGVRQLRDHIALRTVFDVVPTEDFYIEPGAAPVTFNGREVFTISPTRTAPFETAFNSQLETIDFDYGARQFFTPRPFTVEAYQLTFTGCNAAKAQALQDVYYRARGGLGEFYMPTWEADLVINSTATSGTYAIDVIGEDVNEAFAGSTIFRAVAVLFNDNTFEFNNVLGMSAAGGLTTLTMGNAWSQDINPANVRRMMWMPMCRFANDQLDVAWVLRERTATMIMSVETVETPSLAGTGAISLTVPALAGSGTVI